MSRIVLRFVLLAAVTTPLAAYAATAELPKITADSAFPGGDTISLDGLFGSDSVTTSVELVNLASGANRCAVALTTVDGQRLAPIRSLTLVALEARSFLDLLAETTKSFGPLEARAGISCEREFYAYALVDDSARGGVEVVTPIVSPSSLALPVTTECPDLASCFDVPGVFLVPQAPPGAPVGRQRFPAPAGEVERLVLSLDVKVGEWFRGETGGKHLIYWFVINQNPNMPGMLYFRGPGKSQAFAVHGIKLKHAQKKRIIKPFLAKIGTTYHIVNDYDMVGGAYTITVSDAATGEIAVVLRGVPNAAAFTIPPLSSFIIDSGFPPNKVAHEVPSYGWQYSNMHLEAFMKEEEATATSTAATSILGR